MGVRCITYNYLGVIQVLTEFVSLWIERQVKNNAPEQINNLKIFHYFWVGSGC